MRRYIQTLMILLLASNLRAGMILTEENDCLLPYEMQTDEMYTQGAELAYQFETECTAAGLRERMYTPIDITNPNMQPLDRPWAATLTVFWETWDTDKHLGTYKYGIELGVLGPEAQGEYFQTTVHKWTHSRTPKGWANQMPGEPVIQVYGESWHTLATLGSPDAWGIQLCDPVGAHLGTTYINFYGGLALAAGWHPDAPFMDISIAPKLGPNRNNGYLCIVADGRGYAVLHNSTLGESFFYSEHERWVKHSWQVDMEPWVAEGRIGVVMGYGWFSGGYFIEGRTREFETQTFAANWATIRLGIGNTF